MTYNIVIICRAGSRRSRYYIDRTTLGDCNGSNNTTIARRRRLPHVCSDNNKLNGVGCHNRVCIREAVDNEFQLLFARHCRKTFLLH